MLPFPHVQIHLPSWPLLETVTALGGGASIGSDSVDTIEIVRGIHASQGFATGTVYTREYTNSATVQGDPRYQIHYSGSVNDGVAAAAVPGTLVFTFSVINPTTTALTVIDIVDIPINPGTLIQNQRAQQARGFRGVITNRARMVSVQYVNGATAQTAFRLGVYLRPTP